MAINWIAYSCNGNVRSGNLPLIYLEEGSGGSYAFDGNTLRYLEVRTSLDEACRAEIVVLGQKGFRATWVDGVKAPPHPDDVVVCHHERRIFVTGYGLRKGGERRISFGGAWIDACDDAGELARLQILLRRDPY